MATIVHDPRDARVSVREISALIEAGHEVTYLAPFTHFGVEPRSEVTAVDVPAAFGRHRLRALRAARQRIRSLASEHDVIVLHSPELLMAVEGMHHPGIVWDVHEDVPASISLKSWIPSPLRGVMSHAVARMEHRAERKYHLLLAETAYQDRFTRIHPVVPNSTVVPTHVPPTGDDRIVYVGHVTKARGGLALIDVAERLDGVVALDVIGAADDQMRPLLKAAHERGVLRWHGYVANADALKIVEGALAGLSLLADEPNYRHSRPTKIMEYLAHGVPAISTPLPAATALIAKSEGGIVVGFDDAEGVAKAVRRWIDDPVERQRVADVGRSWVAQNANWSLDGPRFVAELERVANG